MTFTFCSFLKAEEGFKDLKGMYEMMQEGEGGEPDEQVGRKGKKNRRVNGEMRDHSTGEGMNRSTESGREQILNLTLFYYSYLFVWLWQLGLFTNRVQM